jgi:AcrR family transcriptional regulator
MGIKQRKDREREEMKKVILDAAIRVSVDEGFEKVSIRKIAEMIEYSPGTIYLYFRNRDEILFELHNIAFRKFYEEQLTTAGIENPWERLREHGKVYIRFALDNPDLYELMFIVQAPGNEIEINQSWNAGMKTFEYLKQNIQECIDHGYLLGKDANVMSIAMWSFCHGLVSLFLRKRMAMVPKEYIRPVLFDAFDTMLNNLDQKK